VKLALRPFLSGTQVQEARRGEGMSPKAVRSLSPHFEAMRARLRADSHLLFGVPSPSPSSLPITSPRWTLLIPQVWRELKTLTRTNKPCESVEPNDGHRVTQDPVFPTVFVFERKRGRSFRNLARRASSSDNFHRRRARSLTHTRLHTLEISVYRRLVLFGAGSGITASSPRDYRVRRYQRCHIHGNCFPRDVLRGESV